MHSTWGNLEVSEYINRENLLIQLEPEEKKSKNGRIEKSRMKKKVTSGWKIFENQSPKCNLEIQLFLAYFLVSLAFVGMPCFCLIIENSKEGLTIYLAIESIKLTSNDVAIDFLRCFFWKVLSSFRRCWMAAIGF